MRRRPGQGSGDERDRDDEHGSSGEEQGQDQPGQRGGAEPDQDGQAHAQLLVEVGVDVVDQRGEQVAPASTETPGHEGDDEVEDACPTLGEQAESDVVGDQPFGVPEDRPRQSEGADADDRHHQQQHGRVLGGPRDQPAGRGGERDSGGRGQHPERRRAREPEAHPRRGDGLVESRRVSVGGHLPRHRDRLLDLRRGQADDVVGLRQQGRAVRDREDAPVAREVADDLEQHLLGLGVQVCGRLVQHHVGTVGHDHPCQREPGALPGGEAAAVLAELGGG